MMHPGLLFLLVLFLLSSALGDDDDVAVLLQKVKPALQGASWNAELASWNASTQPCQWRGLRWKELQVVSIRLPGAALAGHLPPELGAFSGLESLYLGGNSLSGSIPPELGNAPALAVLDLAGNALSGALPVSLWNLCRARVRELRLHGNALSGPIAGPNSSCDGLRVLDLGANRFSGEFPSFVLGFRGLRRLDLGQNNLSGPIPPQLLLNNNLRALNLSYNNFSGQLPASSGFGPDSFAGNSPALCGPPLHRQCGGGGGLRMRRSRGVAGMVIVLMAGGVVAASLCIGWAHNRNRGGGARQESSEDGEEMVVFEGGEHLTPEDVLNATTGQVVAKSSGYSTVYRAKLPDGGGGITELRLLLLPLMPGSREDDEEVLVRRIGVARHENLVPLRAFYRGRRGEKLLVYDDGFPGTCRTTLHHLLLHSGEQLTWPRRHKIALGVARALAYLHTGLLGFSLTHGNLRSSTVLVDDHHFVPRLADYALPKLEEEDEDADAYTAPELRAPSPSCATKCTDVYAFGVLLLQLLLLTPNLALPPRALPALVKAAVLNLKEDNDDDHALSLLGAADLLQNPMLIKLAMGCCAPLPQARPTMPEVVRHLQDCSPAAET